MERRKVSFETQNITAGNVPANRCNEISFYNPAGNASAFYINQIPVNVGCIFTLSCHVDEEDTTNYTARVNNTTDTYFVIRKYYK